MFVIHSRALVLPAVLAVGLAACLGWPSPAAAQDPCPDHDLFLASVDVTKISKCPLPLGATVLVNGHDDHTLGSGDAEILFFWADGTKPQPAKYDAWEWEYLGALPIEWTKGILGKGAKWPLDFTVAKSRLGWFVPQTPQSFYLRAEVRYVQDVGDRSPMNDVLVVGPLANELSPVCFGFGCIWPCAIDPIDHDHDFDPSELLQLRAAAAPAGGEPSEVAWRSPGPLCDLVSCPDCLAAGTCGEERLTLLVGVAAETATVRLLADGETVAESMVLPRPLPHAGRDYPQLLTFSSRPGIAYDLELRTTRGDDGEGFSLPMVLLGDDAGTAE